MEETIVTNCISFSPPSDYQNHYYKNNDSHAWMKFSLPSRAIIAKKKNDPYPIKFLVPKKQLRNESKNNNRTNAKTAAILLYSSCRCHTLQGWRDNLCCAESIFEKRIFLGRGLCVENK